MRLLILGLLQWGPLTAYDVQRFLRQGMYLMYSDSLGAIQSALEGLRRSGDISVTAKVEKGRNKNVFDVTPAGRNTFRHWMMAVPNNDSASEREQMVCLFFLGHLANDDRAEVLDGLTRGLQKKMEVLSQVLKDAQNVATTPQTATIARYQMATIELALLSAQTQHSFCQQLQGARP